MAALHYPETIPTELALISQLTSVLRSTTTTIRRVTVVCSRIGKAPKYYTFRQRLGFEEDTILRHIEPASSHQLEIRKLSNYDLVQHPTDTPDIHLYYGTERNRKVDPHQCFFVRAVVKHRVLETAEANPPVVANRPRASSIGTPVFEVLVTEVERLVSTSLEAIDVATSDSRYKNSFGHHIFLNVVPPFMASDQSIENVVLQLGNRHGSKMWRLKVRRMEVQLHIMRAPNTPSLPVRLFISNPSGHFFRVHVYRQVVDANGSLIFRPLPSSLGRGLDGMLLIFRSAQISAELWDSRKYPNPIITLSLPSWPLLNSSRNHELSDYTLRISSEVYPPNQPFKLWFGCKQGRRKVSHVLERESLALSFALVASEFGC